MFRLVLALAFVHTVVGDYGCNRPGDHMIGDLCYTISNLKLTYLDAQSACNQNNQLLAVVHNTFQANFLASLVRGNVSSDPFWIGLCRSTTGSRFQWDDGTTMTWSNFDSSLPKNQLYVAESTSNGKWQTLDGQQALYFACSYYPGNAYSTDYPSGNSTGYPMSYPPSNSTGYPMSYPPSNSTGFPVSWPSGNTTDYPMSYPPSNSTGYPMSYPPSNSTGYPVSYPAGNGTESPVSYPPAGGNGTDYPASNTPGSPVSGTPGYPASVPYQDSTGYPASRPYRTVSI